MKRFTDNKLSPEDYRSKKVAHKREMARKRKRNQKKGHYGEKVAS